MKSLIVKSLEAHEVIQEIAAFLEVPCIQNCDDYSLTIPEDFGEGNIRALNFRNGMGILIFEGFFKDDFEIQWVKDGIHPLKFMYCLKGNLQHRFIGDDTIHEVKEYQSYIVSNIGKNGHVIRFSKDELIHFISLKINREKFNPKYKCYIEKAAPDLQKIFADYSTEIFYYQGPFTVEIWNLFQQIKRNSFHPLSRRLFFEAFSFHLMVIQLLQFEDDQRNDCEKTMLRQSEVNTIHEVALLIETDLENIKTIPEYSRKSGLNPNKLQSGFQLIFNCTVNEYIQMQRLKKALYLLHNTDLSMKEIRDRIGLNSQSYFSKIFKEAYGYSPSEYRKIQGSI